MASAILPRPKCAPFNSPRRKYPPRPLFQVACWTRALLEAIAAVWLPAEFPDEMIDFYVADFFVLGVKKAVPLLREDAGEHWKPWVAFQKEFHAFYREFERMGFADAFFAVQEETGRQIPHTRTRRSLCDYFTAEEVVVLQRVDEGRFDPCWATLEDAMQLPDIFVPLDAPSLPLDERSCCVCKAEYGTPNPGWKDCQAEEPVGLPCGHALGNQCILRWISCEWAKNSCPLCRTPIFDEGRLLHEGRITDYEPDHWYRFDTLANQALQMMTGGHISWADLPEEDTEEDESPRTHLK